MYDEALIDTAVAKLKEGLGGAPVRKIEDEFLGYFDELAITVWLESEVTDQFVGAALERAKAILSAALPQEVRWAIALYRGFEQVVSYDSRHG
jgi:hypothetical protein